MKSILKVLYIAVVGAVVFTGALMIAEGLRAHDQAQRAPASAEERLPLILDLDEGSAL